MTIGRKIALGFSCLIALSLASGLYQLHLVQSMQEQSRRLVEIDYRAATAAAQFSNRLVEIDQFSSRLYASSRPQPYAARLEELGAEFSRDLDELLALELSSGDRKAFERLQTAWQQLEPKLQADRLLAGLSDSDTLDLLRQRLDAVFQESQLVVEAIRDTLRIAVESARHTTLRARRVAWTSGVLALGLALALAWGIVRSITLPVRRLVGATLRLASGDFSSRVEEMASDEIGELSRNFNRMARRLEELDQLKRDFVSHVSHDLKAPLASIQETTTILLEGIPGPVSDKQARLMHLTLNCSRRLSAMINNLLDLSRLEAGVAEYGFQDADFGALVQTVVTEVEPLATEKGCRLLQPSLDDGPPLRCDPDRMMQVVRNLLDNALNFSPPGAPILIELTHLPRLPDDLPEPLRTTFERWPEEAYLRLIVADQGPGVGDDHKLRVFEKFHQVKKGGKVPGQGVGLGLAISRSIIEAHGGKIWVSDNQPRGSRFVFVVPLSGPPPSLAVPAFKTL